MPVDVFAPEEVWEEADPDVEALLDEWLVGEGDEVAAQQPVAKIIVIKTTFEVVAPTAGHVAISVDQGGTFGPGDRVAVIVESVTPTDDPGSGVDNPSRAADNAGAPSTMRRAVAEATTKAWSAPQVAVATEVDMSACVACRDALRAQFGPDTRVSITHLILRAAALTLRSHELLNGHVDETGRRLSKRINLGLAVALDDGVVVPVIEDADAMSVGDIATEAQSVADLSRAGRLSPARMQGGTFTVSTLGATGIDWFTPILNSPQIAILGVGRVVERAAVKDGVLVVAPMATLTVVFDHRAVNGAPAGRFLAALRERLEDATSL